MKPSATSGRRRSTRALMRRALHPSLVILASLLAMTPTVAQAQGIGPAGECGILKPPGQYGPFDYRTATFEQKDLVERFHFNLEYKALMRGVDRTEGMSSNVAAGFDYTLRAFPNHHFALAGMERLSARKGNAEKLEGAPFRVECWFLRAIEFTPDDGLVRALYGIYFARRGRADAALDQLQQAATMSGSDPNAMIQVAAAYLELKRYEEAQQAAQKAYDLGYPVFGLRDRMKRMGQWK